MPSEYESLLLEYPCDKCGADALQRCKTKSGAEASSSHYARHRAASRDGKIPMNETVAPARITAGM